MACFSAATVVFAVCCCWTRLWFWLSSCALRSARRFARDSSPFGNPTPRPNSAPRVKTAAKASTPAAPITQRRRVFGSAWNWSSQWWKIVEAMLVQISSRSLIPSRGGRRNPTHRYDHGNLQPFTPAPVAPHLPKVRGLCLNPAHDRRGRLPPECGHRASERAWPSVLGAARAARRLAVSARRHEYRRNSGRGDVPRVGGRDRPARGPGRNPRLDPRLVALSVAAALCPARPAADLHRPEAGVVPAQDAGRGRSVPAGQPRHA